MIPLRPLQFDFPSALRSRPQLEALPSLELSSEQGFRLCFLLKSSATLEFWAP